MKILIVEDDFTSRIVLQKQLSAFGDTELAVNGKEAVSAFEMALEEKEPYRLICMDVMMPEMDGREALRSIRELEEKAGILGNARAKIIMTTALGGAKDIVSAFSDECDGYLVKPIRKKEITKLFEMLELDT